MAALLFSQDTHRHNAILMSQGPYFREDNHDGANHLVLMVGRFIRKAAHTTHWTNDFPELSTWFRITETRVLGTANFVKIP